jgi:hypothetical protein
MKKAMKVSGLAAMLMLVLACAPGAAAVPTADLQATMAAGIAETKAAQQPAAPAQPQIDLQATVDAQVRLTMAVQQATEMHQEAIALATEIAAALAENAQSTVDEPPASGQLAVPEADSSGTGEAAMAALIQELYDGRRISMVEGQYYKLDDFNNSVYKNQTHEWWRANQQASDFVLRAQVSWRGDARASASGCGFLYSGLALDDYHLTVLSTEGIVHTYRSRGGKVIEMKGGKYSKSLGVSAGQAEIMLVVDAQKMTFYVNGEEVVSFKDTYLSSGQVGYAINSFSPNGINCQMTNVELWKIY